MPKLPGIGQRDAVRVFQKLGYRIARDSGHIIMSNGKTRLVIPRHNPINAITMGGIAKAAGLTPEQFRELLLTQCVGQTPTLKSDLTKLFHRPICGMVVREKICWL